MHLVKGYDCKCCHKVHSQYTLEERNANDINGKSL